MRKHRSIVAFATSSIFLLSIPSIVWSTASNSGRPPASLSSIINDLEAEGISKGILTATIVDSRKVSTHSRSSLLRSIISYGVSDEDRESALEEFNDDVTSVGKLVNGVGVAFAAASSPSEAASTVQACGRSILYVPSEVDLYRGEGLFDTLAPAVETVLNYSTDSDHEGEKDSKLVVLLPCKEGDTEALERMKYQFESAASNMIRHLLSKGRRPSSIGDAFDNIIYLAGDSTDEGCAARIVEAFCAENREGSSFRDPIVAKAAVAAAVPFSLDSLFMADGGNVQNAHLSPSEAAFMRKIQPMRRKALQEGLAAVSGATSSGDETQLVSNFGDLCSAAIMTTSNSFDASVGSQTTSALVKTSKCLLLDELSSDLEEIYEKQLSELKLASYEKFRQRLSGLRVSPNLTKDMHGVVKESSKDFSTAASRLLPKGTIVPPTWASLALAAKADLCKSMKEYCTDRLLAARVSGAYKPAPRKAVTVGLHWLLPQPFGADVKQAEVDRESGRNYVYHQKQAEVNTEDIRSGKGDWKNRIVPSLAASDTVYQQQPPN